MAPGTDATRRTVRLAQRGQVEPFHVMEVLKAANQRAASHGDVITCLLYTSRCV